MITHGRSYGDAFWRHGLRWCWLVVWSAGVGGNAASAQAPDIVQTLEFICSDAPTPSAHASTIVETSAGTLLAAWFGGTAEGQDDVEIWLSRKAPDDEWSAPRPVTNDPRVPTWNPVLFEDADTTWLFYKVGPSPSQWVGAYLRSSDDGRTWGSPTILPAGLVGPVRTNRGRNANWDGSPRPATGACAGSWWRRRGRSCARSPRRRRRCARGPGRSRSGAGNSLTQHAGPNALRRRRGIVGAVRSFVPPKCAGTLASHPRARTEG